MKEKGAIEIVQNWLGFTYKNHPLFTIKLTKEENIIEGLIRGLQIELGIPANGIWNKDTTDAFEHLFPNGLSQETKCATDRRIINIIYILQGGFYIARGISPGEMNGCFGDDLTIAIKKFQEQAGLEQDGIVKAYLLKSILSLDSYELDQDGDQEIREIQQNLNHKYYNEIGLIPTNGIYDVKTNMALRRVIEIELGSMENDENEQYVNR